SQYVENALYIKFKSITPNSSKGENRWIDINTLFPKKSKNASYEFSPEAYSMQLFENKVLNTSFRIELEPSSNIEKAILDLQKDERIEKIERVPMHHILAQNTPNDVYRENIEGVETSWFLDMIGYKEVYPKYKGNSAIKVAIIDNAIWGIHEDLSLQYENMYDAFEGMSGNANPPKNVNQNEEPPLGMSSAYAWSHGTHCAGLVGAISNNGKGISSLASGITLMGAKCAKNDPRDIERTYNGILWAVDHGAKILSMSLGTTSYSAIEEEVIRTCVEKGILLIAAAGNSNKDERNYPGAYKGVIAVASVDSDQKRSSFSNYGTWVDIAAPGGFYVSDTGVIASNMILSTTYCVNQTHKDKKAFKGKYYDEMSGTSMATPIVASLVALIASYYPTLNAYQMLEILQQAACKPENINLQIHSTSGIINAPKSLSLLEEAQSKYVNNLRAQSVKEGICLSWEQPDNTVDLKGYAIYVNDSLYLDMYSQTQLKMPLLDTQTYIVGVKALYPTLSSLTKYVKISDSNKLKIEKIDSSIQAVFIGNGGHTLYIQSPSAVHVEIFDILGKIRL
ncbi:MAG: S8 family serine peptidase, partial [Bacteroidales bacterium]